MKKIIQIMMTPDDSIWQNRLLGLDDRGVTYETDREGKWVEFIPPLVVVDVSGKARNFKVCQEGGKFPCNPCCEELGC